MEIFKREEAIKRLLDSLDIPQLVFPYETEEGIGPYEPDFFEKYEVRRKASELRAKDALNEMTDEDLWELSETAHRLNSFSFEFHLFDPPPWYAGGFNVIVRKADFGFWAKMDFWTIEEATCLSIGFKPEKMPKIPEENFSPYKSLDFFWNRMSLIQRAPFILDSEQDAIKPSTFVNWAADKAIEMPAELIAAVQSNTVIERPQMLATVDKRKYDSALKVLLGLLSSQFGYRGGEITAEMKKDINSGLAELGLNLDRKTLIRTLGDSIKARERFQTEQKRRDEKDV